MPGFQLFPRGPATHPHAPSPCRVPAAPESERSQKHLRPDPAAAGPGGQGHLALKSVNSAKCRQTEGRRQELPLGPLECVQKGLLCGKVHPPPFPIQLLGWKTKEAEERDYDDNDAYHSFWLIQQAPALLILKSADPHTLKRGFSPIEAQRPLPSGSGHLLFL